jgi:xanthine dehydrogenase YagS FAD-binding subunit
MGTLGGNLLQATRCWYWRLKFPCYLHGGNVCHAKAGQHREHAIFGNDRCASAHPSDPAAALLALGATMRTTDRELPVAELYRLPTDDDRDVTTLRPGELILELDVPWPEASVYLKAMDRRKWSFALVGVAAARFPDGVRLGLAGVAPIPWALSSPDDLDQATALPGTAYKVDIARALVRRALEAVEGGAIAAS